MRSILNRRSRRARNRWAITAGAAGTAHRDEIEQVLRGDWDMPLDCGCQVIVSSDPGYDRLSELRRLGPAEPGSTLR
jgi:hypothetical protein